MNSDIHSLTSVKPMRCITNWWWGCELSGRRWRWTELRRRPSLYVRQRRTGCGKPCCCRWNAAAEPEPVLTKDPEAVVCLSSECPEVFQINTRVTQLDPSSFGYSRWHFDLLRPHAGASLQTDQPCRAGKTSIGEKFQKKNPKCSIWVLVAVTEEGLKLRQGFSFFFPNDPVIKRKDFVFWAHQGVGRLKRGALWSLFF